MALDCLRLWKASCLAGIITTSGIKMPRIKYKQYLPEVLYGCHHQMYRKKSFFKFNWAPHSFYSMKRFRCLNTGNSPTEGRMAMVHIQFVTAWLVTIMPLGPTWSLLFLILHGRVFSVPLYSVVRLFMV